MSISIFPDRNKTHQAKWSTGLEIVYSMLLSTWNSEYALQLQNLKTIYCRYVRQPMCLLMLLRYSKIHLNQ